MKLCANCGAPAVVLRELDSGTWEPTCARCKPAAATGKARPVDRPFGEALTLTKQEAADVLGLSLSSFDRHVLPKVAVVTGIGSSVRIARSELERWLDQNQGMALD